ncbi:MAG: hypothetical protein JRK26_16425 [Deltaproteobacteria bacterium]|nr:hypothetical protein [Deltaproteobacteria bacterium]
MNVLFVCTANISRSYLAEKIMKHTAERFGLKNIEDTESVEWADVILVMEQRHKNWIQTLWPWTKEKLQLLGQYLSEDQTEAEIDDPYGSSLEEYQVAQSQITMAVEALARLIYEEMRHAGNGA